MRELGHFQARTDAARTRFHRHVLDLPRGHAERGCRRVCGKQFAFTVTGGEVLITSLYLKVTTAIAAAGGTLALQTNPTTGDTVTVVAATDLGTTDSAAGTLIGVVDESTTTPDFRKGGRALTNVPVTTGTVELVGGSSVDGAVTAVCTWVPLTNGAALVAS